MKQSVVVVVGKTKRVLNKFGATNVTPVQVGAFSGNILNRTGVKFLDFSEFHPCAFYRWPLLKGDAERIIAQLTYITTFKS